MALNIVNGQVVADKGINAPTYNDPFFDFNGQTYQNAAATDPALAMTLGAGNQGGLASGVQAFLPPSANTLFNSAGATGYSDQQLKDLAGSFGYDTAGMDNAGMLSMLNDKLKNYVNVQGLSAGWNSSSDPRQANATLYQRQDGKLVPLSTSGYSAPQQGSWLGDNPEFLMGIAPAAAGLAFGALGGAAAGGGAGDAVGSGMAYMGPGSAGAGAAGEGVSTLGQLQAMYAGLPGWGQGALSGAGMGGIRGGLSGGWEGALRGAGMGAVTGGVGGLAASGLSGLGAPSWLSGLGWKLAGVGTGIGFGSLLGGAGAGSQGSGGLSGGVDGGVAGTSQNGSQIGLPNAHLGYAQQQEKNWLDQSYAPIQAEKDRLAALKTIKDNQGDYADDWAQA